MASLKCPVYGWGCRRTTSPPSPFRPMGGDSWSCLASGEQQLASQYPHLLRCPSWAWSMPPLPCSAHLCQWLSWPGLGLCWPVPLFLLAALASRGPQGLTGGGGPARGLALNFSCVRACVSFPAPGLTLRLWRVVTMVRLTSSGPGAGLSRTCSHPAPCPPPSPTASLALRASLCSGMCALALPACLPPSPPSIQVLGNSGECSRSSLHSCFQAQLSCPLPASLSLVCPLCPLTLPSDLSWVSTSPSAVPTSSGVPALPSHLPLSGGPSIPHSHSAIPPGPWAGLVLIQLLGLHWLVQHLPSCLFPSALYSAPSAARRPAPTSLLLLTFPSLLPLGLFSSKAAACALVCSS